MNPSPPVPAVPITPAAARRRQINRWRLAPNYTILVLLALTTLGPILVLAFNSLKSAADIGRNPLGLPVGLMWENYARAWEIGGFAVTSRNSLILVVGTVVLVLLLAGPAAYSMAKLKPPGVGGLIAYFFVASTLPLFLFLIPLFYLWVKIGLYNNLFGLILLYTAFNAPFAIFLLRSYLIGLPKSLEDAAQVDGANDFQVFTRVIVPLAWPAFLTVGLVVALNVWNEYVLATVFLSDQEKFTIVTSYQNFSTRFSQDWSLTSAAAMMMVLPILAIFFALQRQFIEGLTQGSVKG